jgi:hypothetical protein
VDSWTGFGTLLENKAEWQKTGEGLMTWIMFHALRSPTPYVLSNRAVTKQWVPPYNVSLHYRGTSVLRYLNGSGTGHVQTPPKEER